MGVIMNMPMNMIGVVILYLVVILVLAMRVDVMRVVHLMCFLYHIAVCP